MPDRSIGLLFSHGLELRDEGSQPRKAFFHVLVRNRVGETDVFVGPEGLTWHHDDAGIVWPESVAPFKVALVVPTLVAIAVVMFGATAVRVTVTV